jgi:hypothetical protein
LQHLKFADPDVEVGDEEPSLLSQTVPQRRKNDRKPKKRDSQSTGASDAGGAVEASESGAQPKPPKRSRRRIVEE